MERSGPTRLDSEAHPLRMLAIRIAAGDGPSQLAGELGDLGAVDRARVYEAAWLSPLRRAEFEEAARRAIARRHRGRRAKR